MNESPVGLVSEIVEARRWLNVSFEHTFGFKLFRQNELAVADLYKNEGRRCETEREFGGQIVVLANLVDDIDVSAIESKIGKSEKKLGSINGLERLLTAEGRQVPSDAFEALRAIRTLRSKRYPIHRDDVEFFEAIQWFGHVQPSVNWNELWVSCLRGYWNSLLRIREALYAESSKLIAAVERVGARNASIISKMTGMPKDSVQSALAHSFTRLGLRVSVDVNYGRLGLQRWFGAFDFGPVSVPRINPVIDALARSAFLTSVARQAIGPSYIMDFAVPFALEEEFSAFLRTMVTNRLLETYGLRNIEWSKSYSVNQYFDLRLGSWSIDWEKLRQEVRSNERAELPDAEVAGTADTIDMLLVKEFELDPLRSLDGVSAKIRVSKKTTSFHYRHHVMPIIGSSYVQWLPPSAEGVSKSLGLIIEFDRLDAKTLAQVRMVFRKLPFVFNEAGTTDGYYQTSMTVPPPHLSELLRFINSALPTLARPTTHTIDISSTRRYTIPFGNFDARNGWFFDSKHATKEIKAALAPKE